MHKIVERPKKDAVKAALELSGLSVEEFARLSYCTKETALDWLDGRALMHPAFWELTGIKLAEKLKKESSNDKAA